MIGKKFGRLIVLKYSHSYKHHRFWLCKCDCGNQSKIKTKYLNNGDTKSCGCLVKEISSKNSKNMYKKSSACKRKEGIYFDGVKHPLYNVWKSMKRRCYSTNCREYRWYGAKRIKVCEEWVNNPEVFIEWGISNHYLPGLQVDRIDRDGNYEPINCEFVTRLENLRRMHERKNGTSCKGKKNS